MIGTCRDLYKITNTMIPYAYNLLTVSFTFNVLQHDIGNCSGLHYMSFSRQEDR